MLMASIEQAFLFFPLALGVYLTYAVLKTTDLTVDGSFVLGAAIFAKLTIHGLSPLLCLLGAMVAGSLAGLGVSLIQLKERISPLVASILAVFMLSSINLMIMGKPNIGLLKATTLVNQLPGSLKLPLLIAIGLLVALGMGFLLKSKCGLTLRALGENALLVRKMGKSSQLYKSFGLMISSLLAAFCGAMSAQVHGYADINMGFGMALIAIATVAIGEQLQKNLLKAYLPPVFIRLSFCLLAVFIYFFLLNFLIQCGINPLHLKVAIGLLLVASLALSGKKEDSHA